MLPAYPCEVLCPARQDVAIFLSATLICRLETHVDLTVHAMLQLLPSAQVAYAAAAAASLPPSTAPPFGRYQVILLGDRGT